jgi:hypothetical protein
VRELGIVVALIVLMLLVSAMWVTPWESLYRAGIWLTVAGFVVGVPTGFIYHVRLYQVLHPRGELPKGWYWRPIQYNRQLRPDERPGVMAWCYVGGAGFAVICLGLLTMVGGIAMAVGKG